LRARQAHPALRTLVVSLCDEGETYRTVHFDPEGMAG
jgi:hypothetical protein